MKLRMPSQPFLQIANTVIQLGILVALGLCALYLSRIDGFLATVPSTKSLRALNAQGRKEAIQQIPIVEVKGAVEVIGTVTVDDPISVNIQ